MSKRMAGVAVAVLALSSWLPILGNSTVEARLYDVRYHPDRIMDSALSNWEYTTDDVGDIASIVDVMVPVRDRIYGNPDHQYFLIQGGGSCGPNARQKPPIRMDQRT